MRRKTKRRWIVPALFALILFLAAPAISIVSQDLEKLLQPYKPWLWGAAILALIVTVAAIWYDHRQSEEDEQVDMGEVLEQYQDQRERYLRRVVEGTQYLPLATLDIKAADASTGEQERMRLPDVYIKLDTTARVDVEAKKGGRAKRDAEAMGRDTRPLPALEALVRSKRIVLLGEPGGGKTTFVNHLAFCLASDTLDHRGGWVQRLDAWPQEWDSLLPVPVVLRDLAAWLERNKRPERKTGLFEAYLAWRLQQMGLTDFYGTLHDLLRRGDAILLLDGLDEVPGDTNTCLRVREMLDDLPTAYKSPMVVTCRVLSYQDKRWKLDAEKWPAYELDKLDEEKIDGFVAAWYAQLKAMSPMPDADVRAGKLRRAVRQKDLWRLAQNPLLLTVMALVHTRKGELPDARALLYQDAVEILLWRWEGGKIQREEGEDVTWRLLLQQADLEDVDVQLALWELAFNAHAQVRDAADSEATADIAETTLEGSLRKLAPDGSQTWVEAMIQLIKLRAGLLVEERPGVYRFPHRTFQEYLAACHLSRQPDFTEQAEALAAEGTSWWVVILLAVGQLVHGNKDIDKPLMLVRELCPPEAPPEKDAAAWRKIWLAGACLQEIGLKRSQRREMGQELLPQLQIRLIFPHYPRPAGTPRAGRSRRRVERAGRPPRPGRDGGGGGRRVPHGQHGRRQRDAYD